jgi:hypothetical protein
MGLQSGGMVGGWLLGALPEPQPVSNFVIGCYGWLERTCLQILHAG